jgi:N-methylhydantoinase A/oxoprolinase/acetone carboxylase beta subunit
LRAHLPREEAPVPKLRQAGADASAALAGRRLVHLTRPTQVPVFDRDRLRGGNVIEGPAIVAQLDSTTLVAPEWRALVDKRGNLIMERC